MTMTKEAQTIGTKHLWATMILALTGVALSALLTHEFYQIRNGELGFRSFCNINQTVNCDVIAASPYAELFAGIPLSSFSTGWFIAMAVLGLLAFLDDWRKDATKVLLVMAGFGGVMSVLYFAIMAMVLKTYCIYCLGIDAVNFALVAVLYFLRPRGSKNLPEPGRLKTVAGIVVGSLLVAIVFGKSMDSSSINSQTAREMADSVLSSPQLSVAAGDELPSIGPKNAPITIVEFSDFQCPHCRLGAFMMNTVLNRYPSQVRLVFRNFPLDPSCNPLMQSSLHNTACEAAKTVLCANKQGKFKPVYEELFEKQNTLVPGKPAAIAQEIGLDTAQLSACTSSQEISIAVTRDIEEAKGLGIKATPTFFINGHKLEGVYPAPVWNQIIEHLLRKP